MNLFKNSLLLGSLAALSLVACADDYSRSDEASDDQNDTSADLVRVEIEVVGDGEVFIEEPEVVRCTGDVGLCSFSYARGTQIVFHAEGVFTDELGWQDACEGFGPCKITLDHDQVVVANFMSSSSAGDPLLRDPGEPEWIIDPVPTHPESDFHQEVLSDDTFSIE